MLRRFIKYIAFRTGKLKWLYLKLCKPSGYEYAEFVKKWGRLYSMGNDCALWPYTNITNPEYTRLGNNVMLTACTILGHDGSIAVLNKAYGTKLDRVGKVEIKDNVFVGHGAIVLPGVTIGPNAIVAAGAVVNKNVPEGAIVAGVPARKVGDVDELVERLKKETERLPWASIIKKREGSYDPELEVTLKRMRVREFFENE